MTRDTPLNYADVSTGLHGRRRWSRLALLAAAPVVLTPAVAAVLLWATRQGVLPHHFLCCEHPEVTIASLVVLPGSGALLGLASFVRLAASRRRLKGWVPCAVAMLVNPLLAFLGLGVYGGMRA